MSMVEQKATWVIAVAASAALFVAGCGIVDSPVIAPQTSTEHLLLSAEQFPADSRKIDLHSEQVIAGFGNSASTSSGGEVSGPVTVMPAECMNAQQELAGELRQLLQHAAFTGAQQADGTIFTEIVSETAVDLGKISGIVDRCGKMTVTIDLLGRQLIRTTVITEILPLPKSANDIGGLALRTTSQSDLGGEQFTTSSYTGYAVVGTTTVALNAQKLSGATEEATFEQVFDEAVRKVRGAVQHE
ncbi:hypothetical protein [Nocardia asteroides]|uniref:hypothetical protein n=1 Tax=Nocardia asteroides TaxID=1824 RepID=UPI0033C1D6AB